MICLSRKKKTSVYRQSFAAETASPVVASAACLTKDQENEFFFAGVARTKSVRSPNDGQGETVDEYFTLAIGGMVTILNTSGRPLCNGEESMPVHLKWMWPLRLLLRCPLHFTLTCAPLSFHPPPYPFLLHCHSTSLYRPAAPPPLLGTSILPFVSVSTGDLVEWTFIGPPFRNNSEGTVNANKRTRPDYGPRRIAVRQAGISSQRVIGRVMHFSKPGENVDILLKQ